MHLVRQQLALPSWLRLSRSTARLRLTLFYGSLFVICGAALLAITYFLFEGATNKTTVTIPGVKVPSNGSSAQQLQQLQAQVLFQAGVQAQRLHASYLHQLLIQGVIALAIVTGLAIVLGWLVAGRVLSPLRTITETARRISASNLHERLALQGPDDEFKELGGTLDDLLGRLDASFESQRHFVANASHELRTPLTVERTLIQVALADPSASADSLRAACEKVLASGKQQEHLIEALLTLASSEQGLDRRETFDLAELAEKVLLARHSIVDRQGLRVVSKLAPSCSSGDPTLVERLVANLVDNALRYNIAGGCVNIVTGTIAGRAFVMVHNTGTLVPAGEVERLFQPFQRLSNGRARHSNGNGLGLSIVEAIAKAHSAVITARARSEGGLEIEVSFPSQTGTSPAVPGRG
jgi:signal transduction histidine kinase